MTVTERSGIRLPDPGAGFIWDEVPPTVVLRPRTERVRAAFTTRVGGGSPSPFDSLNLSAAVVDGPHADVAANRALACGTVGGGKLSLVRQVHGDRVVAASEASEGSEADGLFTREPDRIVSILVADCVPVLLAAQDCAGVAHAGWRGAVSGVVENAVRQVGPCEVYAGPAIGPCCFEVGPEVVEQFEAKFGSQVVAAERHVDLWAAVEIAARSAGATSVACARLCTFCHPDLFFSHRRDNGRTGRQGLLARLP